MTEQLGPPAARAPLLRSNGNSRVTLPSRHDRCSGPPPAEAEGFADCYPAVCEPGDIERFARGHAPGVGRCAGIFRCGVPGWAEPLEAAGYRVGMALAATEAEARDYSRSRPGRTAHVPATTDAAGMAALASQHGPFDLVVGSVLPAVHRPRLVGSGLAGRRLMLDRLLRCWLLLRPRPAAMIFEADRGLLTGNGWKALAAMIRKAGYSLTVAAYDAAQCGVPQTRVTSYAVCVIEDRVSTDLPLRVASRRLAPRASLVGHCPGVVGPLRHADTADVAISTPFPRLFVGCQPATSGAGPLAKARVLDIKQYREVAGCPLTLTLPAAFPAALKRLCEAIVPAQAALALLSLIWPDDPRLRAAEGRSGCGAAPTRAAHAPIEAASPGGLKPGAPPWASGATGRAPLGTVAGCAIGPAGPLVPEDCALCGSAGWAPTLRSLYSLSQAVVWASHLVGWPTQTHWPTLGLRQFIHGVGSDAWTLLHRGRRLIVYCNNSASAPDVAEACFACSSLALLGRGSSGTVIARATQYRAAQRWLEHQQGLLDGRPLAVLQHGYWRCPHGLMTEEVAAWTYDLTRTTAAAVTEVGVRRAYRRHLVSELTLGKRHDNLRLLMGDYNRSDDTQFGWRPKCWSARHLAGGDPYLEQRALYEALSANAAVCVQGLLDCIAYERAQLSGSTFRLPPRRNDTQSVENGDLAYTEEQIRAATARYPGACVLDPFHFSDSHAENCEFCLEETARSRAAAATAADLERREARKSTGRTSRKWTRSKRKAKIHAASHENRSPNVHRPFRHSRDCYFHLLFLRLYFGFLWTVDGFVTGHTHGVDRLEDQYPFGPRADDHPLANRGRGPPSLVSPDIYTDPIKMAAYTRGLDKWYGARNMCFPYAQLPPTTWPSGWAESTPMPHRLPEGWRPAWSIPQRVVVKQKAEFTWRYGDLEEGVAIDRLRTPQTGEPRCRWRQGDEIELLLQYADDGGVVNREATASWVAGWVNEVDNKGGTPHYTIRVAGPLPKARTVCSFNLNFNQYYRSGSLRYTGPEDLVSQLHVGDYISVVDIKSFYLKIALAIRMLRYFAFLDATGRVNGRKAWLIASRLPFGAGLSCFCSSMVSSECTDRLRAKGRSAHRGLKSRKATFRRRIKPAKKLSAADRRTALRLAFAKWGERSVVRSYIDDIGLAAAEPEQAAAAVEILVADLSRAGLPAEDKDDTWTPRQQQKYLGILVCTRVEYPPGSGLFVIELRMTEGYANYLRQQLTQVLGRWANQPGDVQLDDQVEARRGGEDRWTKATVTAHCDASTEHYDLRYRDGKTERAVPRRMMRRLPAGISIDFDRLRSLVGSLQWVGMVMHGAASRLSSLYELQAVHKRQHRASVFASVTTKAKLAYKRVQLEAEVVMDLAWFLDRLNDSGWRGSKVVYSDLADPIMLTATDPIKLKSDAAGLLGYGWYVMQKGEAEPPLGQQPWTAEQEDLLGDDMCAKELWPAREAARVMGPTWRGKRVVFGQDNAGAVFCLCAGRAKTPAARQIFRDMGDLEAEYLFDSMGAWVPRELNVVADKLSRQLTWSEAIRGG